MLIGKWKRISEKKKLENSREILIDRLMEDIPKIKNFGV